MTHSPQFDWLLVGFILQFLVSSVADAMEPPIENDGRLYRFVYRLLHVLAANWSKAGRPSGGK